MRHSHIIAAIAGVLLVSCSGSEKTVDVKSNPTLDILREAVAQGKFLYAHQDDPSYGHTWRVSPEDVLTDDISRSDIKMVCGDFPAIMGFDLGGIELGSDSNLDGVSFAFMRRAAIEHHRRGGIITFSWHPRNPLTGGDAWDVSSNEVVGSILQGGENHDKFMGWLSNAADFLDSIRDAEGNAIPVIFRPWHEHTGSWFWWGRDLCSIEQYVALWEMTYDYLVNERELCNMVWAYSPGDGKSDSDYMERYPGDGMVDILGLDCYQYHDDEDFVSRLGTSLNHIDKIAAERGKVAALTETGFEGIKEADWWTRVLLPAVEGHNISYLLTWRNAWNVETHFYGPWPGSGDADDFRTFYDSEKTVFLNDLKK